MPSPLRPTVMEVLPQLAARQDLTREQARAAMEEILSGTVTPAQIAMFIVALRAKGEVAEEVIGLAQAVRSRANPVRPQTAETLLDTCGTGGDASGTFNISTAVAFVVAGCGVRVAKHCNRSISSQCGSADVAEAMGVHIALSPEGMAACIDAVGIGFLFAPALHSAWKHAQPVRRALRVRTVFNMLGPLCNPAGAAAQLSGFYERRLVPLAAHALVELGVRHALLVHGEFDGKTGLDEISTTGETAIAEVHHGTIRLFTLRPEDVGLQRAAPADLRGGTLADNVRTLRDLFAGAKGPKRDIVLLNAAAALMAADRATNWQEGMAQAAQAIDSGAARQKLEALAEFSSRLAAGDATK
ncbi:MAG TPA: anthranilate phosphoribosyltransferase [Terriglobia bacterium]|nr:anthranilate phosphoribosyltransferase [Terriglobia bacterium]